MNKERKPDNKEESKDGSDAEAEEFRRALNEELGNISGFESSDDSREEIKKEFLKKEQEEQNENQAKAKSNQKMNQWYLKEFQEQMGLDIEDSDDQGDKDGGKTEKSSSSDSDDVSDWGNTSSDGSPGEEWLSSIKSVNLLSLGKRDSKLKPEEECNPRPAYSGPMPSMPIYDEETSQFEMVQTFKEPETSVQRLKIEKKKNDSDKSDSDRSEKDKDKSSSDSDSSSESSSSSDTSSREDEEVSASTDFDDQAATNKISYWEEMSGLPVDNGEITHEELMAILKEEENSPEKGPNAQENQSDSEMDVDAGAGLVNPNDGSDFFEDNAQFPEVLENFSVLVIKEDSVFVEYDLAVRNIVKLVRLAPSHYKYEIFLLLYPLIAIAYLQMIASDKVQRARLFLNRYQDHLDDSFSSRILKIRYICRPDEVPNKARKLLAGHEKLDIQMSEGAHRQIIYCMEDWPRGQQEILLAHFKIQSYSEAAIPQQRYMPGQPLLEPIFYGAPEPLHKKDFSTRPFLQKRRRRKNEPQICKNLHLPLPGKIYNPNPKRMDLLHRKNDEQHRDRLDRNKLPSTYLYTSAPSDEVVLCVTFSESISMLALGTVSSTIYIFSLKPSKLVQLKPATWLKVLDTGMAGIDKGMLDPTKKFTRRTLHGHQGPVYGCSFDPEDRFMLSCSEDFTVRLWCLLSWNCVVIYPGHLSPVCFVVYAPMGFYFATASDDCTARIWVQDSRKPARILQGHLAELAVCQFHPNRHYLATGSADCTVRMWDLVSGLQVRLFRGHKDRITTLVFSICGRYLVSGGDDKLIIIWDTASETLVRFLDHHQSSINTMAIALDNNLLVVGGQDYQLSVWDFERVLKEYLSRSKTLRKKSNAETHESSVQDLLVNSFFSKGEPFYTIHFSRRNLLLAFCVSPRESRNEVPEDTTEQPKDKLVEELNDWFDFMDLMKFKACSGLGNKLTLDTSCVEEENEFE
ncbi:transcription initiation factor TFIID subunit 5 [Drosophila eugracilis]|uniref:transcription initiation factor TFIID subunit 5 n=1 Tax=Drosophila eugracilis TaxID=29029 RepID=UPI0007E71EBE|nr:transcription initiation factor TFIID subunit 5 [Drosophila eugracilis]XP_017081347.1 transcription initiation factor TFIID subunit 5 [Drosophila eugracilis]